MCYNVKERRESIQESAFITNERKKNIKKETVAVTVAVKPIKSTERLCRASLFYYI
jgi:hypothetical protein